MLLSFFFKFGLVIKRKIKMYKCSKQVYLISNLKKKKISALDICCMWGEVCLCLLIEKSTNHFSRKKKWTVIFQGKCYWSKFFFCMVHCFGQCHNVQWYEMHKMCNFSKSHWSFANIWGVFPFKKCAINRLYQIFTSKIFKGPLLGNKSKQVPSLTTLT